MGPWQQVTELIQVWSDGAFRDVRDNASLGTGQEAAEGEVAPGVNPILPNSSLLLSISFSSQAPTQLVDNNFSGVLIILICKRENIDILIY